MEYTKQTWTAPTGTGLSRYAKSAESASHVTLTLDPENLTNSPTPFTMERMAHMEDGIAKAYDTAPPTPWAQYSGKDIPQIPDNLAGTTYKRDNDWVDVDGWGPGHSSITLSVEDETLKVVYNGTRPDTGITITKNISATGKFIKGHIKCTVPITNVQYYSGTAYVSLTLATPNAYETDFYGYMPTTSTNIILAINAGQITAKTCWLSQLYIGTGAYDRLVFDNSYHYRHLLNNAVVPTPQGLYFNGSTSYLRSKEKITLPDVFTFSATVNCARNSFDQVFFAQGTTAIPTIPFIVVFRISNTDNLSILTSNGISRVEAFLASNFFTGLDNTDIKIEISVDFINKTTKVYRNGIQFGSIVSSPTMVKPVTDNIYYGDFVAGTGNLLGYMRNICLFDTALTDTQRNWLAQGNTPPILYDVTNYELGNADTATKLATARKIGSVYFDGTQDITLWTKVAEITAPSTSININLEAYEYLQISLYNSDGTVCASSFAKISDVLTHAIVCTFSHFISSVNIYGGCLVLIEPNYVRLEQLFDSAGFAFGKIIVYAM